MSLKDDIAAARAHMNAGHSYADFMQGKAPRMSREEIDARTAPREPNERPHPAPAGRLIRPQKEPRP